MSRTIIELKSNNPQRDTDTIERILSSHNYKKQSQNGEEYYKCGVGFFVAPKFIKYYFNNDTLVLEGWVRNFAFGPESDLNGVGGAIPKRSCKKVIDEICYNITGNTPTTANTFSSNPTNNTPIIENNEPKAEMEDTLKNKLFYKYDKYRNINRISKTKTITVIWFIILFLLDIIYPLSELFNLQFASFTYGFVFALFRSLIATIPIFVMGWLFSFYNEKRYEENLSNPNLKDKLNESTLLTELLYKLDYTTNTFVISKTKLITIIVFILLLLISSGNMFDLYYYDLLDYLRYTLMGSLTANIILCIIVFGIGMLLSGNHRNKNIYNSSYSIQQPTQQQPTQQQPTQQQPTYNKQLIDNAQEDYTKLMFQQITQNQKNEETKENTQKHLEKDNLGTIHDTIEKANAYWLGERFQMEEKPPFTLYTFKTQKDAEEALLELPYIHKADDTGKLICDKVFQYGYYKVNEDNYEAIICGKDLTIDEFNLAEEAFKKHNGKLKNNLKPEKTILETSTKKTSNGVRYRETIKENQFTYECYDADTREEAQEFLKEKTVTQKLYYVCVYTPEGNYGKDINGIYQM